MITSSKTLCFWMLALVLMSGCASIPMEDAGHDEKALLQPTIKTTNPPTCYPSCEAACWKRVAFEGRVNDLQSLDGAGAGKQVALYEGLDVIEKTVADSEGRFKISADLYGKPGENGTWLPEPYYVLAVVNEYGVCGKVLLCEARDPSNVSLTVK